jgi:hypothetical protein
LLKHLPEPWHDGLFECFRLFLRTGYSPPAWKHSLTVFLHKGSDPALLSNWRPLGLSNSIAKLYHACLADSLYRFATAAGLLSDTQYGFRRERNCHQALQYVYGLFEDAKCTRQPLYAAYIDFADAFGSVQLDVLVDILSRLGIPHDGIAAIADMYTDAHTDLQFPGHSGAPPRVAWRRGTLQGDTLSPLIFLLFLEPLLQMLQAGCDGYQPGCGNHPANLRSRDRPGQGCSSAYADDLLLFARSLAGLKTALAKVAAFCDWTCVSVNASKCAITATEPRPPTAACSLKARCEQLTISGEKVPFRTEKQAYKYLGIPTTLTMANSHHFQRLYNEISRRLDQLDATPLFASDARRCIESLVVSTIAYSLPLCLLSPAHLDTLQRRLSKSFRHIYGLPRGIAREALYYPEKNGGLAFTNLAALSAAAVAESSFSALTDPGRLGCLSRALVRTQLYSVGNDLDLVASRPHWPESPWLSRLSCMRRANLGFIGLDCIPTSTALKPTHLERCRSILSPLVQRAAETASATSSPTETSRARSLRLSRARAQATAELDSCVLALLELGAHSVVSLLQPDVHPPEIITTDAFVVAFPAATSVHTTALLRLKGYWAAYTEALRPTLQTAFDTRSSPAVVTALQETPVPGRLLPLTLSDDDARWNAHIVESIDSWRDIRRPDVWNGPRVPPSAADFYDHPTQYGLFHPKRTRESFSSTVSPASILHHRTGQEGELEFYTHKWPETELWTGNSEFAEVRNLIGQPLGGGPTQGGIRRYMIRNHWAPLSPWLRKQRVFLDYLNARGIDPASLPETPFSAEVSADDPPPGSEAAAAAPTCKHVCVNTERANPDTAIYTQGRATAYYVGAGRFKVYDRGGAYRGAITENRMRFLWRRWTASRVASALSPTDESAFLQAVSAALKRNENGRCSDIDGHKIDHRQHWATPTETMRILRSLTRFSTECFASIFNADTQSANVITAHREDRAFGALFDAFAHRWSGSFYFNAEYNVEPMRDAVEHAIASVQAATARGEPCMGVSVFPKWTCQPFYRAIKSHPNCCHIIAETPAGGFHFDKVSHDPSCDSPTSPHPGQDRARWPVIFVVFANEAGLHEYYNPAVLNDLKTDLEERALSIKYPGDRHRLTSQARKYKLVRQSVTVSSPTEDIQTPSRLPPSLYFKARRLAKLVERLKDLPGLPVSAGATDVTLPLPSFPLSLTQLNRSPAPLVETQCAVFTDGSHKTGRIGVGVYDTKPCAPATCLPDWAGVFFRGRQRHCSPR